MNDEQKTSVLSRVKKMLNLANDAACSEGERDNAMRMVHAILAKYNLSMSEAEAAGTKSDDQRIAGTDESQNYPWIRRCAHGVSELFFCKYFFTAQHNGKVRHTYIGRESNTITARDITQYVIKSVWKEANARQRQHPGDTSYWTSFCNGAAIQIFERCKTLRAEAEAASREAPKMSSGTSLVLASVYASEMEANKNYLATVLKIKLHTVSDRSRNYSTGFHAGREFGKSVSLNRQVGGQTSRKAISS